MVRDILIPSVCFVASLAALVYFAGKVLHERPCKEYGEITGLQTESMYSFGHIPRCYKYVDDEWRIVYLPSDLYKARLYHDD